MGLLGFEVWSWFGNASASGARFWFFQAADTPIRACRLFLLTAQCDLFRLD